MKKILLMSVVAIAMMAVSGTTANAQATPPDSPMCSLLLNRDDFLWAAYVANCMPGGIPSGSEWCSKLRDQITLNCWDLQENDCWIPPLCYSNY